MVTPKERDDAYFDNKRKAEAVALGLPENATWDQISAKKRGETAEAASPPANKTPRKSVPARRSLRPQE